MQPSANLGGECSANTSFCHGLSIQRLVSRHLVSFFIHHVDHLPIVYESTCRTVDANASAMASRCMLVDGGGISTRPPARVHCIRTSELPTCSSFSSSASLLTNKAHTFCVGFC